MTDQDSQAPGRTGAARVAQDTLGHAADDAGVLLRALRDYFGLALAVPMDGVVQRLVAAGWDALDVADASDARAAVAEARQVDLADLHASQLAAESAQSADGDVDYFRALCAELQRELKKSLPPRKYGDGLRRCLAAAADHTAQPDATSAG